MKNTLHVSLYKEPFEVMETGEKDREYRVDSTRNKSLIYHKNGVLKDLKYLKATNGYGHKRPYFVAEIKYITRAKINYTMKYSNGLVVRISKGNFIIRLGRIIERGNTDNIKQLTFDGIRR